MEKLGRPSRSACGRRRETGIAKIVEGLNEVLTMDKKHLLL